jgi:hypothetical protein
VPLCVGVPAPISHLDHEEMLTHAEHSGTFSQEWQYAPPIGINKHLHIIINNDDCDYD